MIENTTITLALRSLLGGDPKRFLTYSVPPADPNKRSVVGVLDEFSRECFAPDLRFFPAAPQDIAFALDALKPEYVFVESAWNGNSGSWLYQITSPTGPKQTLYNLIAECRKREIPTVFWNKEDPPHFEDFLGAAREFDYVFTTEESLVDHYAAAAGHSNIGVLQFAAQPHIHSPLQVEGFRGGNIAFAGQYFAHKFKERREQMDILFPAAQQLGFSIYSRMLNGDPNYAFPERYAGNVVDSLPYSAMIRAYRKYKVFLNVNSVPQSKSMCARRVFELSSCKTSTVSAYSPAIASAYSPQEVFTVASQIEARDVLTLLVRDNLFRERSAHLAWRETAKRHLYSHRLQQIAETIGLPSVPSEEKIYVILAGKHLEGIRGLIRDLASQVGVDVDGVTIIADPGIMSQAMAKGLLRDAGLELSVSVTDAAGAERTVLPSSAYVAFLTESLNYGPHYLEDLWLYLKHYASTPVVAKGVTMSDPKPDSAYSTYGWPEDTEATELISGAWLAARGSAWAELVALGLAAEGGEVSVDSPVTLTDRFNIRWANGATSGEWTI
ncbi:glycosyltransferase [Arthrobacter sp. zg-Y916]|uniref:glycosyltransferase family protein n=1 Tax=Arthrobacter sp. zg-Y916 TaxID=2894190 RepID=UPI001E412D0C|nr:glycosyltransferase [Arthrobacter sp. zg-Y916]MCC9193850.1 glycosyltransferase [Arthrobacter sp. zg-Y916]